MRVKDIMITDVLTVSIEDSVEHCAQLMIEHKVGGLPVFDREGRLAGMITEGDLIRRAAHFKEPGFLPILGGLIPLDDPQHFLEEMRRAKALHAGRLMTREIFTVRADEPLEKAATIMLRKHVNRLPVVDDEGRLTGIISRRDLVQALYPAEEGAHA